MLVKVLPRIVLGLALITTAHAQIYNSPPAQTVTSGGGTGNITGSGGSPQVTYWNGTNSITGDSNFIYSPSVFSVSSSILTFGATAVSSTANGRFTFKQQCDTIGCGLAIERPAGGFAQIYADNNGLHNTLGGTDLFINSSGAGLDIFPSGGARFAVLGNVSATGFTTAGVVTSTLVTSTFAYGQYASYTNVAGTLTTAAQPSITSVGTLSGLASSGLITGVTVSSSYAYAHYASYTNVVAGTISSTGGISATGNVSANQFIGNGSLLTGIAGGGQISFTSFVTASTVTWTTPSNITSATVFKLTMTGGGGGGGASTASKMGNGGSAGSTCIKYLSGLSPNTGYSFVIGAGGSASGNGSVSTFNDGVTLYTAGQGVANGGTSAGCTNTDFTAQGASGATGLTVSSATAITGGSIIGAPSFWGGGTAYGAGGNGGNAGGSNAGAVGRAGASLIEWIN